MASIDKHIVSLLHEHDCVIIPGFGGLIAQYVPVRIHPVRHSMTPPYKKIAFNHKLQVNDGMLVKYVALQEHLSGTDAATRVELFVEAVNLALDQHQRYNLQNIGLFKKENGQPIEFECEEKINLLAESFGLPEVFSKPVQRHRGLAEIRAAVHEKVTERQPLQPTEARQVPLWRKTLRYAALLPVVLLSASALYLATLDRGITLGSLNPASYLLPSLPKLFLAAPPETAIARDFTVTPAQREQFNLALLPESLAPASEPAGSEQPRYLTDEFLSQELPVSEADAAAIADGWGAAISDEKTQAWEQPKAQPQATAKPETAASTAAGWDDNTAPSKRYYIIAGGFLDPDNAQDLHTKALNNGQEAKIIPPGKGSRLHRVSLADFADARQAHQQKAQLTSTYGKALWVLEY